MIRKQSAEIPNLLPSVRDLSLFPATMLKLWLHVPFFFVLCFITPSTVGNTEIITLHSSLPVQDLPSEKINISYRFK